MSNNESALLGKEKDFTDPEFSITGTDTCGFLTYIKSICLKELLNVSCRRLTAQDMRLTLKFLIKSFVVVVVLLFLLPLLVNQLDSKEQQNHNKSKVEKKVLMRC